MITSNFHTHTVFSDGIDTPEEMVITAISKGFTSLGFSEHSYTDLDADICLKTEKSPEYINEIKRLKKKYKNEIKIFLGLEIDYFSDDDTSIFDYTIGSVHQIRKNGVEMSVDHSAELTKKWVDQMYSGDFDSYAEDYFELVGNIIEKTNADIIGHFDLVSKFSETLDYGQSERFLISAEKAVKKLVTYGKPFEINTGAISRKKRSIPYPSPEILKMIYTHGGKITFSSDCHNKDYLDCSFKEAEELAKNIGFKEHGIITENGVEFIKI